MSLSKTYHRQSTVTRPTYEHGMNNIGNLYNKSKETRLSSGAIPKYHLLFFDIGERNMINLFT